MCVCVCKHTHTFSLSLSLSLSLFLSSSLSLSHAHVQALVILRNATLCTCSNTQQGSALGGGGSVSGGVDGPVNHADTHASAAYEWEVSARSIV